MLSCRNCLQFFGVKRILNGIQTNFRKNGYIRISRRKYSGPVFQSYMYNDLFLCRSIHITKHCFSYTNRVFMPAEEFLQANKDAKSKQRNNISLSES
ncbi:hypothetical protein X975_18910, partial [Stegodyphus mimosarum]